MKLLELLVQELPKRGGWPEGAEIICSHGNGHVYAYATKGRTSGRQLPIYGGSGQAVTREQYESALAKNGCWIEWGGGECPVEDGTIIDVRYRDGQEKTLPANEHIDGREATNQYWRNCNQINDIIAYRLHKPDINSRANDDRMEQDLNECIGQDVDPAWNGDGLPPVGTICEALMPALDNTLWHWRTVKVVESGAPGAEKEVLAYDIENTKPAWTDEFRPLRTEADKKRDEAIKGMASVIDYRNGCSSKPLAGWIYDAISAGKIPGIKLETK